MISQLPRPPPPRPLQPQLPPRKMMAAAHAPKVVTAMATAQAPKVVVAMLIPPLMSHLSLIMQQRCFQRPVQPAGMALPLHGVACSPMTHFQVTAQRVAFVCTLKKRPTGCRSEEWELQYRNNLGFEWLWLQA